MQQGVFRCLVRVNQLGNVSIGTTNVVHVDFGARKSAAVLKRAA